MKEIAFAITEAVVKSFPMLNIEHLHYNSMPHNELFLGSLQTDSVVECCSLEMIMAGLMAEN